MWSSKAWISPSAQSVFMLIADTVPITFLVHPVLGGNWVCFTFACYENWLLQLFFRQLLCSADVTVAYGRKYGLVGRNGMGKTTLLKMISRCVIILYIFIPTIEFSGQLKIPTGITMLSVEQEVEGDDTLVLDAVLMSDTRRQTMLERERLLQSRLNKLVHLSLAIP